MIVSLVGTHGSGKSVQGELVVGALNGFDGGGWGFVPEIAREILNRFNITENLGVLPVEKIIEVQREILSAKRKKREEIKSSVQIKNYIKNYPRSLIEDRHPLLDVYAYSIYWLSRHPSAALFLDELKKEVEEETKIIRTEDQYIIVVPPNIPLIADGVRNDTFHFRDTINYIILGILDSYNIQYLLLREKSMAGRLEEILYYIQSRVGR